MTALGNIEELYSGLTPTERNKLEQIQTDIRVALGRIYGDDLSDLMTGALVRESICHPDVIAAVSGVEGALPMTRAQWNELAVDLLNGNELAQRNVEFSRESRLHGIRSEELQKLNPQQRMNLARSGQLDEFVEARVSARLEAGS